MDTVQLYRKLRYQVDFLALDLYPLPVRFPPTIPEGFSEGNPAWGDGREELRRCVRIWPHKMKGEGHFLALLKKSEDAP